MSLATFMNIAGPDLIVILLIIAVLAGIPALIAVPIVFILERRKRSRRHSRRFLETHPRHDNTQCHIFRVATSITYQADAKMRRHLTGLAPAKLAENLRRDRLGRERCVGCRLVDSALPMASRPVRVVKVGSVCALQERVRLRV